MSSLRFHLPLSLDSEQACEAAEPALAAIESAVLHLQTQSALVNLADIFDNMNSARGKPYVSSFEFWSQDGELCMGGESEDDGPIFCPSEYRGFGFEPSWEESCAKSELEDWIGALPIGVFHKLARACLCSGGAASRSERAGSLIKYALGEPAYQAWASQSPFDDLSEAGPGLGREPCPIELPCSIDSYDQAQLIDPILAQTQRRVLDLRQQQAAFGLAALLRSAPELSRFVLVRGERGGEALARSNLRDDYPRYPYHCPPCPANPESGLSSDRIDRIQQELAGWARSLPIAARDELLNASIYRPDSEPMGAGLIKQFLSPEGFAQWEAGLLAAQSPKTAAPRRGGMAL